MLKNHETRSLAVSILTKAPVTCQFADAVTTTSPTEGRLKGVDLEGLLSTLHGDPFSTRKQLPRTPESLSKSRLHIWCENTQTWLWDVFSLYSPGFCLLSQVMDVKSSWRKAMEEDKTEKIRRLAKLNDSVTDRPTCPEEPRDTSLSPDVPCSITPAVTAHSSPPVCQQRAVLKSSLLWDTFNTDAQDSPSGTGSSAVQFSLDHETLPEMPSCDSLLSLDDEAVDMESEEEEEEELLIPSLKTEAKYSPLAVARHHGLLQQACLDGSFTDSRNKTPQRLLSGYMLPGLDRDWLKEPAKSVEASDKVFSLDLDSLETSSPPKRQEYSLPTLITFSPIDDKC